MGRWNADMIETDENSCLTGSISEGTNVDDNNNPFYKYLLIRVEAGEHIEVKRTGNALSDMNTKISEDLNTYFSKRENQVGCMKV